MTGSRAFKTFVSIIAILLSGAVLGQRAEFLDGVLVVPEIASAGGAFRAEFTIVSNTDPLQLELIASSPIESSGSLLGASFSENQLTIPEAIMGGESYWLELEHNGNNLFTLRDYGLNQPPPPPTLPRPFTPFPDWGQLHGYAYDIGVGANGSVWVIGTDPQPGGYGIYNIDGYGGFALHGGALRIDVDPFGRPWVVNFDHEIYRLVDGFWQRMPGEALDIGIGADGSVWAASFEGIYLWNGLDWINFGGSGSRIDVGPNGQPWVVGFSDRIYTLDDNGFWVQLPGEAGDIGVGADGSVWVVGVPSDDLFDFEGLQGIYRWNGFDWDQVTGDGLDISVGPDGQPWITNAYGEIWRAF